MFRINAKNFSLTYSNVEQQSGVAWLPWDKESLLRHLESLGDGVIGMVSREQHQDGSTHFHAWVQFPRKRDIRASNFFDWQGCHPNVQATNNLRAWKTYICKDGDHTPEPAAPTATGDLFVLCHSMEKHEWVNYCIGKKIGFQYMEYIWKDCHMDRDSTIEDNPPPEAVMCAALEQFIYPSLDRSPLVLVGDTGCGKTTWAIKNAPKPICFVSHMDQLKHFDPQYHKSIVFDDMDFKHLPRESQIHILDMTTPRAIHRRYGVTVIPAGTKKIFTANSNPFIEDPAIIRRRTLRIVQGL